MKKLFAMITLFSANMLSCAAGPGGVGCAKFYLVAGAERKPVVGATILVYQPDNLVTPADHAVEYSVFPGIYWSGLSQCSGLTIMQIDHREYQSIRMEYRSPHDRSISGNSRTDESTIVMTAR